MEWIKEYWHYVFWGVLFSFCVWHGFKFEFSVGNCAYFSYEIYPLKRFF